jgi:hypothetical protein
MHQTRSYIVVTIQKEKSQVITMPFSGKIVGENFWEKSFNKKKTQEKEM